MQKEEQGYGTCSDFDRLWFQLAADVFKENLLCFVINARTVFRLAVSPLIGRQMLQTSVSAKRFRVDCAGVTDDSVMTLA